jgi:putative transposase
MSSMSAVGHCGDNAAMEGFFGVLKRERVHRRRYLALAEARADVFDYRAPRITSFFTEWY